jgi:predicted nucleotidyltransferase component of viral defense system
MGQFLQLHETPAAFREALGFTAAESGFAQRLIEKDYYCSLILADFEPLFANGLVFKGGTCLSKVYAEFYRLSEDLDFAISIPATARRSGRRRAAAPIKEHLSNISKRLRVVEIASPIDGHNDCRQYEAILRYASMVTGEHETVKVEIAIREPIIESTVFSSIGRTLLRHPVPKEMADTQLSLCVMSLREMYAEKVRAALSRRSPAIRDIFDIAEAMRAKRLDFCEPGFLNLVRQKLAVPGNVVIDINEDWRRSLRNQLETHLKPVLRSSDYVAFDIGHGLSEIENLAAMISGD